jgi:hypothetical protein
MADMGKPIRRTPQDVGEILILQIQGLTGPDIKIARKRERPWASITFSGTRHYIEISPASGRIEHAADQFIKKLPSHEFELPGHFVADLLVRDHAPQDSAIIVEVLTIHDPAG